MGHVKNTLRNRHPRRRTPRPRAGPLYSLHFNPQVEILLDGVQQRGEVLSRRITSTAEHPMETLLVEAGLLR